MRIKRRHPTILLPFAVACMMSAVNIAAFAQPKESQTPLQRQIEVQKNRLTSADAEERRDALMKLNLMRRPEASRAAVASLNDAEPSVRVAAAHALTSAPSSDAANALIPLLQDKLEFVRREVAYALGEGGSRDAIAPLTKLLAADKEMSVRAAAAMALGRIKDETAVIALAKAIDERAPKKKAEENEFLRRAAVESLGEIRSPAGVEILVAVLTTKGNSLDTRRVAAMALGKIGSNSAVPALQAALHSDDPYLAEAAREALRRMHAPLK